MLFEKIIEQNAMHSIELFHVFGRNYYKTKINCNKNTHQEIVYSKSMKCIISTEYRKEILFFHSNYVIKGRREGRAHVGCSYYLMGSLSVFIFVHTPYALK